MADVGDFFGTPTVIEGREPLLGTSVAAFQLPGDDGKRASLRRLTARGPLLMHFYRGNW